jgi:hypothetical protein
MIAAGIILLGACLVLLPVGGLEVSVFGVVLLIVGAVLGARDQLRR